MIGFFPKLMCLLFGCDYWTKASWVGPEWYRYRKCQLNHCRRCHCLKPVHRKALDRVLESNVKLRRENKELKEKLLK